MFWEEHQQGVIGRLTNHVGTKWPLSLVLRSNGSRSHVAVGNCIVGAKEAAALTGLRKINWSCSDAPRSPISTRTVHFVKPKKSLRVSSWCWLTLLTRHLFANWCKNNCVQGFRGASVEIIPSKAARSLNFAKASPVKQPRLIWLRRKPNKRHAEQQTQPTRRPTAKGFPCEINLVSRTF